MNNKDKQRVSLWVDKRKSFWHRCCGKRMTMQVKIFYHQCGRHVARKEKRWRCECCQEVQSPYEDMRL